MIPVVLNLVQGLQVRRELRGVEVDEDFFQLDGGLAGAFRHFGEHCEIIVVNMFRHIQSP
jgi:hypothetical protein